MKRASLPVLLLVAGAAAAELRAQDVKPVSMDFVVQDKKGIPIKDLKAEEIEVTENGVKRPIASLELVEGGSAGQAKAPRYVTLVFDGLDAEGQKNARKAAGEFMAKLLASPDVRVAVFRVGLELWALSGFTNDMAVLTAAVEKATSHEDETLRPQSEQVETTAAREMGVPETTDRARILIEQMRIGDEMNKLRQDGSTLFPLIAVAKGQAAAPGRKTVVYFAQRFDVPSKFDDVFRSLISEANRAGVAIYTIDARGVRGGGDLDAARSAMQQVENVSRSASTDNINPQSARVNFDVAENVAGSTRQDMRVWLGQLSEGTGAVLVGGSNDLRKGTDKVLADTAAYYAITYAPSSNAYDGAYRKIDTKVSRAGVKVQSRAGYFALPPSVGGQTVLAYEIPMLTALTGAAPPKDVEVHGRIFCFGEGQQGRECVMLLDVPMSGLSFAIDEKARTYRLRFGLMAVVKNEKGEVAQRISQIYPFEGPADKVEAMKRGKVGFNRTVQLAPGKYTFEAAVQDRGTQKIGTLRAPFEVPAASGVRLSTVAVVRGVEPVPPNRLAVPDPFRIQTARVTPNIDTPIAKGTNPNFYLFAAVWPSADGAPPAISVEFFKDGKKTGEGKADLLPADEKGRMVFLGEYPTAGFSPGVYEAVVRVKQGSSTAEDKALFTIVP
ncbi:MAG TPA: VWA domain-containing protein [Vicinamibacteria bacterium]|nr:VWA domain-containing protein [Vicinamibacteria bacterium]